MRRKTLVAAVTMVAAAGAVTGAGRARPAGAASNLEVGYWWVGQEQPGAAPAPPSPVVPEGGLWVSSNPSGAQAMSAVRFTLAEDESAPILTLTVASEKPEGGAALLACPTTSSWNAIAAGDWNSRPAQYDCSTAVTANRSLADGATVFAFDLTPINTNPVDVVLVPAPVDVPAPPPGLPAPLPAPAASFDVTFTRPSESNISTFVNPDDSDDEGGEFTTFPPLTLTPADESFAVPGNLPAVPLPVLAPPLSPPPAVIGLRTSPPVAAVLTTPDERSAARVFAALVFLALAAWWYRVTFTGRTGRATTGRPRLSLYDDPRRVLRTSTPSRPARAGKAPALR